MGNSKSSYSKRDLLAYHMEKNNIDEIRTLLETTPQLIHEPMSHSGKWLPLHRASFNGNSNQVDIFLKAGAVVDCETKHRETPLMIAAKRSRFEVVRKLLHAGANPERESLYGLSAIDYAILPGYYEIAFDLYHLRKDQVLKDLEDYRGLGKQYSYRYVNYGMFLEGLKKGTSKADMGEFLVRIKVKLRDPVIDPNENWKNWAKRVANFKDAPLVERDSLPEELQPQNRAFGKIHHYTNNFMKTPASQKTILYPSEANKLVSGGVMMETKRAETSKEINCRQSGELAPDL